MSLSQKVRDLLLTAIELIEDADLSSLACSRKGPKGRLLAHREIWAIRHRKRVYPDATRLWQRR